MKKRAPQDHKFFIPSRLSRITSLPKEKPDAHLQIKHISSTTPTPPSPPHRLTSPSFAITSTATVRLAPLQLIFVVATLRPIVRKTPTKLQYCRLLYRLIQSETTNEAPQSPEFVVVGWNDAFRSSRPPYLASLEGEIDRLCVGGFCLSRDREIVRETKLRCLCRCLVKKRNTNFTHQWCKESDLVDKLEDYERNK